MKFMDNIEEEMSSQFENSARRNRMEEVEGFEVGRPVAREQ